jgi:hypothetical protein
MAIKMRRKLVCGVAINDADYEVDSIVNGSRYICPFYLRWKSMLKRCYKNNGGYKTRTYLNCTVCDEWLKFSSFKKWMETKDWQGKEIDKDLISKGNRIYSPEFCVFVDRLTNSFIVNSEENDHTGAAIHKKTSKFQVRCRNPFNGKREWLGIYHSESEAHEVWRKRKHELACMLADMQTDERAAKALRVRFLCMPEDK